MSEGVEAVLELIYDGALHATPGTATGRLLISPGDLADVTSSHHA